MSSRAIDPQKGHPDTLNQNGKTLETLFLPPETQATQQQLIESGDYRRANSSESAEYLNLLLMKNPAARTPEETEILETYKKEYVQTQDGAMGLDAKGPSEYLYFDRDNGKVRPGAKVLSNDAALLVKK